MDFDLSLVQLFRQSLELENSIRHSESQIETLTKNANNTCLLINLANAESLKFYNHTTPLFDCPKRNLLGMLIFKYL